MLDKAFQLPATALPSAKLCFSNLLLQADLLQLFKETAFSVLSRCLKTLLCRHGLALQGGKLGQLADNR